MFASSNLENTAAVVLGAALEGLLKGDIGPWVDMFTDDGVMEFPFAPDSAPKRISGKDALRNHLGGFNQTFEISSFSKPTFYPVNGQNIVIAEFACDGRALKTGLNYKQKYISVMTFHGEKVGNYRDYWNPLVIMEALGGLDAVARFGEGG